MALWLIPTMVGRIIIPSKIEAVRILLPRPSPPKTFLIIGTITIIPKKPYTIDGIPASRLIGGISHLYSFLGQNFAINTAVRSPIGTPTIIAPAVTYILPIIIGKIPKLGVEFKGLHSVPSRKSATPISAIVGQPLTNMKAHISTTAIIETHAERKNTTPITDSPSLWRLNFLGLIAAAAPAVPLFSISVIITPDYILNSPPTEVDLNLSVQRNASPL